VKVTPAALAAIARTGEGSMRDAQSALDQVIAYAGNQIDVPDVTSALGIVGDEVLYDFFEAIARADAPTVLRLTTRLVEGGHDLRNFTKSMMRAARNLLVIRAVGFDPELVDTAASDSERVTDLARQFSEAELVRAFTMLSELEQEIRQSADPRFQLEIGMVRLAELPRLRPLAEIVDRLAQLEKRLSGAVAASGGGTPPLPAGGRGAAGAPSPQKREAAPPKAMSSPPEPPPIDDEPYGRAPLPPIERPAPPPPRPAAPPEPAKVAVPTGLDGDAAVDAIKHGLEASNKMLLRWL
jgi:DNA polymerase-3 subunit gamma/tau